MYIQKEINDILKIYDRLNSLRGTVRLLGYPSRTKLREWLRERRETGQVRAKSCLRGNNNNELRKKAAKTYIQSGHSLQTAINQFGYNVSQRTIQNWVKKFYPKARKLNNSPIKFHPKRFSWETKIKAVYAMRHPPPSPLSVWLVNTLFHAKLYMLGTRRYLIHALTYRSRL